MSERVSAELFDNGGVRQIDCDQIRTHGPMILGFFDLLSRSRGLEVLAQFADDADPWRFSDLERELGVPPNTLSRHLAELREFGLIEKEMRGPSPPHTEYTATSEALALKPVLQYLYRWADEFTPTM
jgi:DNA-binding HxlR family transcriptional regulator